MPSERSRDLAIPPGRYIHVLDRTKGHVQTINGPSKISMADTEVPVIWDSERNDYRDCNVPEEAVRPNIQARLGEYVVLTNPAADRADIKHPEEGKSSLPPKLDVGNVVIIPGPASFALWWQQGATVIPGHQLRSNQFVVVEVTNDKLAKENWDKAIFKRTLPPPSPDGTDPKDETKQQPKQALGNIDPSQFTMGQRIIIRGTEVSFFIPPTGMRVVPDEKRTNQFVREAVTLESLQYCVLKDENGKKNYVSGPAVVFPKPTESFIEEDGRRVFKAIELNPNSGIHVMVIADYEDDGKKIAAGTELFITGSETAIYYPRPEHAVIKYDGKSIVHFATAVPAGEGRYVMDKKSGEVRLVIGPKMILLNPTNEVFVRRVLPERATRLWYPNNNRAIEVNRQLAIENERSSSEPSAEAVQFRSESLLAKSGRSLDYEAVGAADSIERRSSYTPPRTITLETKYQGAVAVGVWQGYAIQVVSKSGKRRVEVGPKTVLLAYDEDLTQLSLSTGKPKTSDSLRETVYLKLAGNQVSDVVKVETSDGIEISVKLVYQVEFTGDNSKWFDVDNYVKLITDHCRSILRGTVKRHSAADFISQSISIIRDAVLGAKKSEADARTGLLFSQNNVRIYDTEVLAVEVVDTNVSALIKSSQQGIVRGNLDLTANQHRLKITKETEEINRSIILEQQKTAEAKHKASLEEARQKLELALEERRRIDDLSMASKKADLEIQSIATEIAELTLEREKAAANQKHAIETKLQQLQERRLKAESEAVAARLEAIKPELIQAIQASNDRDALVSVAEQIGIAAYLKDRSVGATIDQLLDGTGLQGVFHKLATASRVTENGSHPATASRS